MQQRRVRLGDVLDDYCSRERRITNHAVVAMIEDEVKQTRCTTCDAEHEFKHAKVPAPRRKKPVAAAALVSAEATESPALMSDDDETVEEMIDDPPNPPPSLEAAIESEAPEVAEVVDDVGHPRADQGPDGGQGEEGVHDVVGHPPLAGLGEHEPGADHEPDGDEDPMGADRERPDVDPHDRVIGDGSEHGSCLVPRQAAHGALQRGLTGH